MTGGRNACFYQGASSGCGVFGPAGRSVWGRRLSDHVAESNRSGSRSGTGAAIGIGDRPRSSN